MSPSSAFSLDKCRRRLLRCYLQVMYNLLQPIPRPNASGCWSRLGDELQARGKLDAQKKHDIETLVNRATNEQLSHAVQYYQQRKAEQLAEGQANLHRLEAYRDNLKREVERRKQVYQQEQAITSYGSALAAQQFQWAMGGYYAAPPFYYLPRYHHRW